MVAATGSVSVKPDMARLSFYVVTESPNKAREENDAHVKKLKDKLAALGFAGVEIQTVPYALGTVTAPDPVPMGVPPPRLQHAQTGFVVVVHEKNAVKLGEMAVKLADVAGENGATPTEKIDDPLAALVRLRPEQTQGNPGWATNRMAEQEPRRRSPRPAIKKALSEAKQNAESALPDAKLTLKSVHVSSVQSPYRSSLRSEALQDVPIEVTVTVTYTFE